MDQEEKVSLRFNFCSGLFDLSELVNEISQVNTNLSEVRPKKAKEPKEEPVTDEAMVRAMQVVENKCLKKNVRLM